MPQIERALLRTIPWLIAGLIASLPLLLVDVESHRTTWFIAQLAVLVAFGLGLSYRLAPLADGRWFVQTARRPAIRLGASGVSIVVLVTGMVGLVTMASSAALRFDPSVQYLQVLSALDIAWVGCALMIGLWRAWGRAAAIAGAVMLGIVCVWSIWNYLETVGFGASGEWVVSGSELARLVLPFDVAAATLAVGFFVYGTFVAAGAIEQESPQS
jgi:hypothetical protein